MRSDLPVRVSPRSSRSKLELSPDGSLRVWVTAAPTDGQANAAVCELVAKALGVAKSCISVVRGQASRDKVLGVEGLSLDECLKRLAER